MNITGDVPENSNASEYDTENNAAQIETWGASWGQHNGNTGAKLRIGTLNVEAGQSVAFSSRASTGNDIGAEYYAGTAVTVGSVVMKEAPCFDQVFTKRFWHGRRPGMEHNGR